MSPSVIAVTVQDDHKLLVEFDNGQRGTLDMKPYLDFGVFSKLQDVDAFRRVKVVFDTIEWEVGCDLDPEFVYEKCGKTVPTQG